MDLSDNGDDFDNFFTTKKSKTSTQIAQQKKPKIADPIDYLFGIEEKTETKNPVSRKQASAAIKSSTTPLRITQQEVDDDELGFDPKKPKGLGKLQNLFDDLLKPLESKRPQTAGVGLSKQPISRQSTDTTTDTSNLFQTQAARPKTSQGRRTINMSNIQNTDPLGLFTKDKDSSKSPSSITSPKTQKKRGTTADWLGLTVETEAATEPFKPDPLTVTANTPKLSKVTSKDSAEILQIPENTEMYEDSGDDMLNANVKYEENRARETTEPYTIDSTTQNIMLMNTLNMEAKHSLSALKHQEQQIIMASQMKQQETVLMDMQRKQDALLQRQEKQFQTLFQQQMHRHQQLEELVQHQQQRINTHLQLMMTQPSLQQSMLDFDLPERMSSNKEHLTETLNEENSIRDVTREKHSAIDLIQYESDNKRLELENLRLEELIANTKSNYEREIELLEKSYKKQIEVLDEHLFSLEKRLKSEIAELQIYFQTKIGVLEQEKQNLQKNFDEELANLKQNQEDDLRKVRKNHDEDLEMIKEEHRRMLDNIRQAKMLEFAVVQENGSYIDCLKQASSNLTDLTGGLHELKENMQLKIDNLQFEKEKKLESREKRLEDAERRLRITEDSNAIEKQRLMELVSTLELQLLKTSKDSAEENWQLQQKLASIDAEKKAFDKEKEFFREQMLRDEVRIKELKEQQLMETQRLQLQLQEDKAKLQIDKSKFELEKRLRNNTDVEQERMEVEASMQVAQDAARKSDLERERYYKLQRQLEQQKRDLTDKEHLLNVKEEELHQELISYRMAERVAQESQQKATMAEQFFQNKLQMLQQRTNEIAEKETNLSQERLLLTQDRIALHALKTKLSQQTKCSLCQLTQKNQEINDSLQTNYQPNVASHQMTFQPSNQNQPTDNYDLMTQSNVVERLLDASIADSIRRMQSTPNLCLELQTLLDDDHKKMVQNTEIDYNDEYGISKSNSIPKTYL